MGHGTPLPEHPDRSNLTQIEQSGEAEPSTVNEKTIVDFTPVV
jgi:hypothetical protein